MPQAHRKSHHHKKRHGNHQKRTENFLKTYHPFMPLLLIVTGSLLLFSAFSGPRPKPQTSTPQGPAVLAYATSISSNGLLSATNQRRATAQVGALSVNGQLSQAAQTKANDMATRNYWSHNTPDGTPPWTFISNAGYSYNKAGENLACGFDESSDVVLEWYNSPSHRDNLLHPDYTEVGFGIANSESYNCGNLGATQQTIIVAMYGTPYKAAVPNAVTPKATTNNTSGSTKPAIVTTPASPAQSTGTPAAKHTVILNIVDSNGKPAVNVKVVLHSEPRTGYTDRDGNVTFSDVETGKHTITLETNGTKSDTPIDLTNMASEYKISIVKPELTSNQTGEEVIAQSRSVNRLQTLTNDYAGWVLLFLIIAVVLGVSYLFHKHSRAAHRLIVKGEKYMITHWYIDVMVVLLIIALYYLTRNVASIL